MQVVQAQRDVEWYLTRAVCCDHICHIFRLIRASGVLIVLSKNLLAQFPSASRQHVNDARTLLIRDVVAVSIFSIQVELV
jgi:hypothetical protein